MTEPDAYVPPPVAAAEERPPSASDMRKSETWTEERRAAQSERMKRLVREGRGGGRPRKPRKPKAPKEAKQTRAAEATELLEIQRRLAEVLALPALGMDMAGDEWPAAHTRERAPLLAHAIVERARINPAFRAQLLRVMRISDSGSLYLELVLFILPILLYYELLSPLPVLRRGLGVPARSELRPQPGYGPEEQRVDEETMRAYARQMAAEQATQEQEVRESEREILETMMESSDAAQSAESTAQSDLAPAPGPGPE